MTFTGYAFILFFFVVFAIRWAIPERFAPRMLLGASVLFYLSWGWKLAALLAVMTAFTYGMGVAIQRNQDATSKKKALLAAAIVVQLGVLFAFKYTAFFLSLVAPHLKPPQMPLPLGISFYVFEMVSYVVDVYRGDKGARSLWEFGLYLSYFPHLVAGPIVRASELLPQFATPQKFDSEKVSRGMFILLAGVVKKTVLADNLAVFADTIFKSPKDFNSIEIAVGVLAYTGQIFCDFSGYTDLARGASTMLGYELPENFEYPYLSGSITEFWRRWHMSLSRWLRDYLYISLGGNRGSKFAAYRNLMLTMALGGLWHGARLTFVVWGVYHGLLLVLHKLYMQATSKSPAWKALRERPEYRVVATLSTLLLVAIGWVFFRATSFADAMTVLGSIAKHTVQPGWKPSVALGQAVVFLCGVVALHAAGAAKLGVRSNDGLPPASRGLLWASMLAICYALSNTSPTFIYFYF
ncbi:putative poly(beta-D-mannuronate) O-acetylase [Labilithrix luteola]|uniref:Putative poly(Beta-D-mannuronate) O-acetylase n=1 Tax=Labilithrix luteola TaxID=1391654 RepID=A0A0K1PR42_9BACT|nr:MBOAT family O-acyltransferase [Labilithrix luteola]AKU96010.1 putative poly(beta-D-mannuronate) O-acetylase [Labilithrix luteola]